MFHLKSNSILLIFLIALFSGLLVYAVINNIFHQIDKNLQAQVEDLKSVKTNPTLAPTPSPTPISTPNQLGLKPTYSNNVFGFSFTFPQITSVNDSTNSSNISGTQGEVKVEAPEFRANVSVESIVYSGNTVSSQVIALYRANKLDGTNQITRKTIFKANNFDFSLLDVSGSPAFISAFAKLNNTLVDVTFTWISGKGSLGPNGVSANQNDLPQSARDFLASFKEIK